MANENRRQLTKFVMSLNADQRADLMVLVEGGINMDTLSIVSAVIDEAEELRARLEKPKRGRPAKKAAQSA
jgi:hypothetical protein